MQDKKRNLGSSLVFWTENIQQRWSDRSNSFRDTIFILGLSLVTLSVFAKTVFLGSPISRVVLIANQDVLFREFMPSLKTAYDESVYLMVVPYYHLVANLFRGGELPLWNSFSGFGQPLVGDIILSVFSPLKLLFSLHPDLYFYNLIIVVELLIATIGTFLIARALGLSKLASMLPALAYGMCPFILWFAELPSGTSACLLPVLILTFVQMANSLTLARSVVAGATAGLFILSGHPEVSFLGITFSSALMTALSFYNPAEGRTKWQSLLRALTLLVVAGISALCVCGISFFPFIEYVLNSDTYKFSAFASVVPWQAVFFNLFQPFYGGLSPFIGALIIPLTLAAFVSSGVQRKQVQILFVLLLSSFFLACRPGNLAAIFEGTPVNWIPGTYCLCFVFLSLLLISAIGFECLLKESNKGRARILFLVGSVVALLIPLGLQLIHTDFSVGNFEDASPKGMSFQWRVWIINIIVLAISVASIFLLKNNAFRRPILGLVLIACNFVSLTNPAKESLPIQAKMLYKTSDPIPFLQQKHERIATIGYDILTPNSNIVFGVPSIGVHAPLVPGRYETFMRALRGKTIFRKTGTPVRNFNTLLTNPKLTKMIDMTGIRYIVSLQPISGLDDSATETVLVEQKQPVTFSRKNKSVKISDSTIGYDATTEEIRGSLKWTGQKEELEKLSYSVVIVDSTGNTLWYGGQLPIKFKEGSENLGSCDTEFSAFVPLNFSKGKKFTVGLKVFDTVNFCFLEPETGSTSILQEYTKGSSSPTSSTKAQPHFLPVYESSPHHIRVYTNTQGVDRAYLVHDVISVNTPEQALTAISAKNFDPHKQVIIETKPSDKNIREWKNSEPSKTEKPVESVSIVTDRSNKVELKVKCAQDGMLVLTDMNYPGWQASLDNKSTPIYQSNFLFRSIFVPKGIHTVTFTYEPLTFKIGMIMLVAFIVSVFTYFGLMRHRR